MTVPSFLANKTLDLDAVFTPIVSVELTFLVLLLSLAKTQRDHQILDDHTLFIIQTTWRQEGPVNYGSLWRERKELNFYFTEPSTGHCSLHSTPSVHKLFHIVAGKF